MNNNTVAKESPQPSPDKSRIEDLEMDVNDLKDQINHIRGNMLTWGHMVVFIILFPIAFVVADNWVKVWNAVKTCFSFLSGLGESTANGALALVGIKSGFETVTLIVGGAFAVLLIGSVLGFILYLIGRIIDRRKK